MIISFNFPAKTLQASACQINRSYHCVALNDMFKKKGSSSDASHASVLIYCKF